MMQRHRSAAQVLFFLLTLFLGSAAGTPSHAAPDASALLDDANSCRKSLLASSQKMKFRHHWMNCIGRFEKIAEEYPRTDEAAWALYFAGRLYSKMYRYSGREEDLENAVLAFKKVSEGHAEHRLADDAQYRIGEIYFERKNFTQAYVEFLKVDIKFPNGDMRKDARAMMDRLASMLSEEKPAEDPPPASGSGEGLARVLDIRHWSTPSYTRVVVDMDRPVKYEEHLLKKDSKLNKPRRLYVDLKGASARSIESTIPIRDGLLRRARAGQFTNETVRVVLDIDSIDDYKIFPLHDPFRIVIDVRGTKTAEQEKQKIEELKKKARKGIRKVNKPDDDISLARQLGLSVQRIVLDPGHGGKDPGCLFSGGIREKDIVLKLARVLALKLEKELGCEVLLTRMDDVFLPLEKRTAFANTEKGDLFISLHINAHRQSSISGLETYFLNMATDERAVLVAARENSTSEKNISDLQTILNDLMLNTKISESSKLAYEVHNGMVTRVGKNYNNRVKSLGVKQAPFYVLIGAEMPAILVETGFITNPTDRKRLTSSKYLETLADGIVDGIRAYIKSIELAFKAED